MLPGLGGAASNLQAEAAQVLGKSQESATRQSFNRDFGWGEFSGFDGADVGGSKFIEIASYEVPASTEYSWGYGSAQNPENQGYLYVDLNDGTDAVDGVIRFAQESPTGRNSRVVADFDTTRLDASTSDRTQQVPFPEQVSHPLVTQDSKLVVYLKTSDDTTLDLAGSTAILPVTEYDLSQG
jgi:hypothetical protein